jgi:hypothetical protein
VRIFAPECLITISTASVTRMGKGMGVRGLPVRRSDGHDYVQPLGNRHFRDDLSRNGRDGVVERQHVFGDGLPVNVERNWMDPQDFLFPQTTRQLVSGI